VERNIRNAVGNNMEKIKNISPELHEIYQINPIIEKEVDDYLDKLNNPELSLEEYKKNRLWLEEKTKENPEYRLAYLRKNVKYDKNPTVSITNRLVMEIFELESVLKNKHRK
jgi:hypothetical protein